MPLNSQNEGSKWKLYNHIFESNDVVEKESQLRKRRLRHENRENWESKWDRKNMQIERAI
jgi:hypothetical protein